jgi:hypothetical protein
MPQVSAVGLLPKNHPALPQRCLLYQLAQKVKQCPNSDVADCDSGHRASRSPHPDRHHRLDDYRSFLSRSSPAQNSLSLTV